MYVPWYVYMYMHMCSRKFMHATNKRKHINIQLRRHIPYLFQVTKFEGDYKIFCHFTFLTI